MVGGEAEPGVVADDGRAAGAVFLHGPGTLGLIFGEGVEEIALEDGVVEEEGYLFGLGLHVAEVRIFVQVEGIDFVQALEGTVTGYFVVFGEAHSALGNDVAVVLDSEDGVEETVDFLEVDFDEVGVFVFLDTGGEWVFLLDLLLFFLWDLLAFDGLRDVILDLDQNLVRLSFKHTRERII